MASDSCVLREDTIGPWSEQVKLEVNRRYLPVYMQIMAPQRRRWCTGGVHYVDGFAGTGQPFARGEERRVDGSPRIALELAQPFDSYTFIERTAWRAKQLRELCGQYPHLNTRVIEEDCNFAILESVTPRIRRDRFARGFAYLDPFGLHLKYSTIEAIAKTEAIEVIINLPTTAMNRNGLPNDPGKLTTSHFERMDSLWGDRSWYGLIYEERRGLLGPQVVKPAKSSAERLGKLFKRHLQNIFPHVGEPLVVRNSGGQPIYCLIFAGPNCTGTKIAEHVRRSIVATGPVPRRATPPSSSANLPLPFLA